MHSRTPLTPVQRPQEVLLSFADSIQPWYGIPLGRVNYSARHDRREKLDLILCLHV